MCFGGNAGQSQADQITAQNAADQARRQTATNQVNATFGVGVGNEANTAARNQLYDKVQSDTMDFLRGDADRQDQVANRNLLFNLARTGQAGGSLAVDQQRQVDDQYQRGILTAALQSEGARQSAVSGDEQVRQDLITRINAGMTANDALASAGTAMAASLETARRQAIVNGIGSLFSNDAWAQQYGTAGTPNTATAYPYYGGGSTLGSTLGKPNSGQITGP